ncbi:MAG: hypothetical protein ACRDLA_19050, partial [Thermoleophilaceae bacterium]
TNPNRSQTTTCARSKAQVGDVIRNGDPPTRKTLLQSLVDEIRVKSRAEIHPTCSLPAVRPPAALAPPRGFEPPVASGPGVVRRSRLMERFWYSSVLREAVRRMAEA